LTYIRRISMTGFKSFGNRTVTVRLSPGFTCIVGPNGAGKSNIIDALCFALGRLSKKTMRAEKLEDLIFAGSRGHKEGNRASVTLYFDNSEGMFPGGTEEFQITRVVRRNKGNKYKMNGKNTTRQQILDVLASANIDPDGSNQFVLQGKIVELTHMGTIERREFIEELIGLQKYDEMKEETMKELEKAERDLGQFEAIFKEVSSQLKKVEKEKNDALAWKELEQEINSLKSKLIALKISKLKKKEEEIENHIEETKKIIEELEEKITYQKDLVEQESLVMENIQRSINQKEIERDEINENITELKTQLSSSKTTLNLAEKSLAKLIGEKTELEKKQMKLEENQTYENLIAETQDKIKEIEADVEEMKNEIDKRQQSQTQIDNQLNAKEKEKTKLRADISELKQNISSKESTISHLKENIEKNSQKREKLEIELNNLKGDAKSVQEAIKKKKEQENIIRKEIDNLKNQISKENENRRKLEERINSKRKEENEMNSQISELNSTLSSINTEIKMHNENITELQNKKQEIKSKIENLSKGKDIEDALVELNQNKKDKLAKIEKLRKDLKDLNFEFQKKEKNLELYQMKLDSIISEINDNQSKISNLQTRENLYKKELKELEREEKNLSMKIPSLEENLSKIKKKLEHLEIKKDNIARRLSELNAEKKKTQKRIDIAEEEYQKDKEDIEGILQILNMLTQNINISVESIKSNIQQSNAEAIEMSADDFRKFILDVIDMMKTVEDVSCEAEEGDEMDSMLNSIMQTLSLFTDNADETIGQLITKVKDSVDVAVQDSTSNFDNFVQDLMEILENMHLSLRKLTVSKSQDLYKQLEEIIGNIKSQDDEMNKLEKQISELEIQKKHDLEDLSISKSKLSGVKENIEDLRDRITDSIEEIKEREEIIEKRNNDKEEIEEKINQLKLSKEKHWEEISNIQLEIEEKRKELDQIQEKLQDLRDVQTLFDNIEATDEAIAKSKNIIEEKKLGISKINEKIKSLENNKRKVLDDIDKLDEDKENFWEETENLQQKIETKNQVLEKILDELRSLENIQRMINTIKELEQENIDSENKIEKNQQEINNLNQNILEIQKSINNIQEEIETLRKAKSKEIEAQKSAQKELNQLNKNLQTAQNKLNELKKNKERADRIKSIIEEISQTKTQITDLNSKIEDIEKDLEKINNEKDQKQKEIDTLTKEKDESWNKQKKYQEVYTDLKSDLSMKQSKLNNLESNKIVTTDQIETLYQRSKDYGALPHITEELTEEKLQSDIKEATKNKEALEPVNLKAIKQYDSVKERFDEIDMRRQTIQRERKSILDAIEKIELQKTQTFMKAYHEINREFSKIFQKLSPGGSAKMILDRPDKPFEGGISIEARPRGKKIASLEILSGGEKTLVALSFIFAVQEFYPAPFYVMDEIDAALDGPNVHRVSMVIKEFAEQAQFLIISHREENIVNADRIYGVSMQESGITDIFSVDLEEEAKRLLETEEATSKA